MRLRSMLALGLVAGLLAVAGPAMAYENLDPVNHALDVDVGAADPALMLPLLDELPRSVSLDYAMICLMSPEPGGQDGGGDDPAPEPPQTPPGDPAPGEPAPQPQAAFFMRC